MTRRREIAEWILMGTLAIIFAPEVLAVTIAVIGYNMIASLYPNL